jgi:integrase
MPSTPALERTRTPGVYKRGASYVVRFRDPSGKQRKRFVKTYNEAKRLRAALATDVSRGEFRDVSRVTFAEYAAEWIESYAGRTTRGLREETRSDYKARLEADAIPYLGKMRLAEIEARDLDALAARVAARGCKPNTVRLALAPVKALLATAHQRGEIRSNPAAGYRTRHTTPTLETIDGEPEEKVKALSEDELAALLAALPEEHRLFFTFLAQTGLRIGEAIELRWRDVEGDSLRISRRFYRGRIAPPKTHYGRRRLRLSPGLSRALWTLRKETRTGDDDLVFTAERGGRIEQSNLASRVLKPAAAEAGLGEWVNDANARGGCRAESWVGFHTFRHTCASMLFRAGWNAAQVQRHLGHHKASFTLDTYIHLLDEDVPQPAFFDAKVGVGLGHKWATQEDESRLNAETAETLEKAV